MVSTKFITAVKLAPKRMYQIAWDAEIHPSTLSQICNGIVRVEPGDPRVLAVADVLGLDPRECFETVEEAVS